MNEIELKYKHQGVLIYPSIGFPRQAVLEIIEECKARRIELHSIEAFLLYDKKLGQQPSMDFSISFPPDFPNQRESYTRDEGYADAVRLLSEHPEGLMYEVYMDLPEIPVRFNKDVVDQVFLALSRRLQSIASPGVRIETHRDTMHDGIGYWGIAFRTDGKDAMPIFSIALAERLLFDRTTIMYEYRGEANSFNIDPTSRDQCIELARILSAEQVVDSEGTIVCESILSTSPLELLYRAFDLLQWCEPKSIYL